MSYYVRSRWKENDKFSFTFSFEIPSSLEIFGTPEELNEFVQFLKYLKEVKKWF